MEKVVGDLVLLPDSVHGPDHWSRVERNGLIICREEGIDPEVLKYFAILHDSQRYNDGRDLEHGPRAVKYARQIRGDYIELNNQQFEQLCFAMEYHTVGAETEDLMIQACWDADRLDLGRVFIEPDPERMYTQKATEICFEQAGTLIDDLEM